MLESDSFRFRKGWELGGSKWYGRQLYHRDLNHPLQFYVIHPQFHHMQSVKSPLSTFLVP